MTAIIRQGDVLLVAIDLIPQEAIDITPQTGAIVLAHGEATGHAHAIHDRGTVEAPTARLWRAGAERFLQVMARTPLQHEEHTALALPPGIYKLPSQVEYAPDYRHAYQRVLD